MGVFLSGKGTRHTFDECVALGQTSALLHHEKQVQVHASVRSYSLSLGLQPGTGPNRDPFCSPRRLLPALDHSQLKRSNGFDTKSASHQPNAVNGIYGVRYFRHLQMRSIRNIQTLLTSPHVSTGWLTNKFTMRQEVLRRTAYFSLIRHGAQGKRKKELGMTHSKAIS
jgi:hypothetical protein